MCDLESIRLIAELSGEAAHRLQCGHPVPAWLLWAGQCPRQARHRRPGGALQSQDALDQHHLWHGVSRARP